MSVQIGDAICCHLLTGYCSGSWRTRSTISPGARIVTFGNGMVVREPIISVDPTARRLVWTASGGRATHYNSSVEVTAGPAGGSMVTWTSDFLPDSLEAEINGAMEMGASIMAKTLNKLSV